MSETGLIIRGVGHSDGYSVPVTLEDGSTCIYDFFCGALSMPDPTKERLGCVLLGGKRVSEQAIDPSPFIIHEEILYRDLQEAESVFKNLARYNPMGYLCGNLTDHQAFIDYFIRESIPFQQVSYGKDVSFGLALINRYFREDRLLIGGLCETHLNNADSPVTEALRYLVLGLEHSGLRTPPATDNDYDEEYDWGYEYGRDEITGY